MERKESIFPTIIFPIFILIVGIGLIFLGIKQRQSNLKFIETAIEGEATITKIDEKYESSTESYFHTAYVEYNVRNQKYSAKLPEYNSMMYVGKKVKIYYNLDNPSEFKTPKYSYYIEIIFGAIFTLLALSVIVSIVLGKRKQYKIR